MLQLMMILVFSSLIFRFAWKTLGAGKVITGLLNDERAALRKQLDMVEDTLAELEEDPHPSQTSEVLRSHYEKEARQLRRQLARVR